MTPVTITSGTTPLILGMPHTGTYVPDNIWNKLNPVGQALADTDWHIDKLYADLVPNTTCVKANFHRYVIDANRDPAGLSLYPGQNTTGLCPLTDFDYRPIYLDGYTATVGDIEQRRESFHAIYHTALEAEIKRIKKIHGFAILYDCHSIRSEISFLFAGELPVLNVGTNEGQTCAPWVEKAVHEIAQASPYPSVLNGRFKGGWTTRHYGDPDNNVHAIQMEIAQRSYLSSETTPWTYDETRAAKLRPYLKDILNTLIQHGDKP